MEKVLLLIIMSVCGICSYGQQVEVFKYTTGSNLAPQGGWTKLTTPSSTPEIKVDAKGLNIIEGIQAKSIKLNGTSGQVVLNIDPSSGFEEGKTNSTFPFYAAFPIYVSEGLADGFFFCLRSGNTHRYKIHIKNVSGGFQLGLQITDETPTYDTVNTYSYNQTYQLVFKWKESIPRQANLYVINSELPVAEPINAQITLPSLNSAQKFPHILINQYNGSNMYIGGMIIQNSWPLSDNPTWVKLGEDGKLIYKQDEKGNQIMDFSTAGYMGGGVALPVVSVKVTLNPGSGDQTVAIQNAIDQVKAMPLVNGFRGTVLLTAGTYDVSSTINLNESGVVLRGSGSGSGGTVLNWTGSAGSVCISMKGTGSYYGTNSVNITGTYIPSGTKSFTVSNASAYQVGDNVLVYRTVTDDWIAYVNMDSLVRDGVQQTWISPGSKIVTDRTITAIDGNVITLDAPLTDSYDAEYLGTPIATMVKYTFAGRIEQVGLEHLKIQAPASATAIYSAVAMNNIADSWIKDVVGQETHNAFTVERRSKRITMDSIINNNTIDQTLPAHPSTFSITGTQVLLKDSESNGKGAWAVVTQSLGTGPIVVLNFKSTQDLGIAPHQRWTTGVLIDNCNMPNANEGVAFRNRSIAGNGHGWTTGWSVAWNVNTPKFLVSQAPGTKNWAIGGAGIRTSRVTYGDSDGLYDHFGMTVIPQSLYLQQLSEKLADTLPVSMTSFSAFKENNSVKLKWQTASERNNSHFEILRYSSANNSPVNLVQVLGSGNSNDIRNYVYTDNRPDGGINYYQLRQIDLDGKATLSEVIGVKTGLQYTSFNVYQSANKACIVNINSDEPAVSTLYLTDMTGRILKEMEVMLQKGSNIITLANEPLTPGVYLVSLNTKGRIIDKNKKFLVR